MGCALYQLESRLLAFGRDCWAECLRRGYNSSGFDVPIDTQARCRGYIRSGEFSLSLEHYDFHVEHYVPCYEFKSSASIPYPQLSRFHQTTYIHSEEHLGRTIAGSIGAIKATLQKNMYKAQPVVVAARTTHNIHDIRW